MISNKAVVACFAILVVSGCSSIAPQYQPNFELVNELKDSEYPLMNTGAFAEADESVNHITIRAGAMISPYEKSYAKYLQKALEEELKQSDLWDQASNITIEGTLIKNELDGSGVSLGLADISASFLVRSNGSEIYNKTHTIHHEWKSSFVGAVAVPRAQKNYPISIQKLLRSFLLDKDLVTALENLAN